MQSDISQNQTANTTSETVQGAQAGTPGEVLGPRTTGFAADSADGNARKDDSGDFSARASAETSPGNSSGASPGNPSGAPSGGADIPTAEQAKQQAQQVVQQAHQAAGQVAEQVRDQIQSRLSSEKDRAVEGLEIVGASLRETGQKLQQHGQPLLSEYARSAAETVDSLSGYLKHRDLGQIGREVEDFARSRPALFIGGIFAVGVLSARFFKSTAQAQLPESSDEGRSYSSSGSFAGTRTRPMNPQVETYVREHNSVQADVGAEA